MSAEVNSAAEEMSVEERRAATRRSIANSSGASLFVFESSYWGKEATGDWVNSCWVVNDFSTDKAHHMSHVESGRFGKYKMANEMRSVDNWVPKSKVTEVVHPEYVTEEPDGEAKGEVRFGPKMKTKYGEKVMVTGDTYSAFKEDNVADDIEWEDAHHTFNGDTWVCDSDAVAVVADAMTEAGYKVSVPAGF